MPLNDVIVCSSESHVPIGNVSRVSELVMPAADVHSCASVTEYTTQHRTPLGLMRYVSNTTQACSSILRLQHRYRASDEACVLDTSRRKLMEAMPSSSGVEHEAGSRWSLIVKAK